MNQLKEFLKSLKLLLNFKLHGKEIAYISVVLITQKTNFSPKIDIHFAYKLQISRSQADLSTKSYGRFKTQNYVF